MHTDLALIGMASPTHAGRGGERAHRRSRLGVQLGDMPWLLDLDDVSEVIPVPALRRVPMTKPWFAGVANVRGNLIAVVDFGAFLGAPPLVPSDGARLVLVADRHRINSGLLFSRVAGLRELDDFVRQPDDTPPPAWVEGCYADRQQQRWHALDMHALMTHPDFLQIERQAG